jgi:hypothetical protein
MVKNSFKKIQVPGFYSIVVGKKIEGNGVKWATLDVKISNKILLLSFCFHFSGQCQISFSGLILGQCSGNTL